MAGLGRGVGCGSRWWTALDHCVLTGHFLGVVRELVHVASLYDELANFDRFGGSIVEGQGELTDRDDDVVWQKVTFRRMNVGIRLLPSEQRRHWGAEKGRA